MKLLKYAAILAIVALAACKKEPYNVYEDVARIQFGPANPTYLYNPAYKLLDSLKSTTFYYNDPSVTVSTVNFDVYVIGGPVKADRTFKLEQIQVSGTNVINAVAGKHYVAFNDAQASINYVIKADSVHALVPVLIKRDVSLKTSKVILKFKVVANQSFQLGEATNLWRRLEFTDQLSRPNAWTTYYADAYYGSYSLIKHQFLISSSGQKWDQEFMASLGADFAKMQYWISAAKTALVNYNNIHLGNPLVDEFGALVIFP